MLIAEHEKPAYRKKLAMALAKIGKRHNGIIIHSVDREIEKYSARLEGKNAYNL